MPNRFLDIHDGVAMIVTDLHGDRDAFERYIARFNTLYRAGDVQRLIFLGDLIHAYGPPRRDDSLSIILDTMALVNTLGPDTVTMLLGNHEMPHIYGVQLAKGDLEFTPRFENALGSHREAVLEFFRSLPFYVRTAAGVMLGHAGPSHEVIAQAGALQNFDHDAILHEADQTLAQAPDLNRLYQQYGQLLGAPYAEEARYCLGVTGPDDPRYAHLLRAFMISQQSKPFQLLWDALFTQNELGMVEWAYVQAAQDFLAAFSQGAPAPQRAIVSGHIITPLGGYNLVNRYHLRLSSATHARPREAGRYLLLDCAKPVNGANELLTSLGSVFTEGNDDDDD